MRTIFLFLFYSLFRFSLVYGQIGEATIDSVFHRFNTQLRVFPQEKLYIHTDKPYYAGGEKIWLSAYLLDGASHKPADYSRYIYIELLNGKDSVVNRVKLRPDKGSYSGYLPVSDRLESGEYMLRAYTAFMKNQDENYFFRKRINITGPGDPEQPKTSPVRDFQVEFFPEGGYLVPYTGCRIGFKALNSSGLGEDVYGRIVDEREETVVSFRSLHKGMGYFYLYPVEGKRYYMICQSSSGTKRFPLPVAEPKARTLRIEQEQGKYLVSVLSGSNCTATDRLYLFVHCRGVIRYATALEPGNELLAIDPKDFPSGVLQFLLTDEGLNILSERLVFCKSNDRGSAGIRTDRMQYAPREKISVDVKLTDEQGMPTEGFYSLSVTDNSEVYPDFNSNILIRMLLTSELRGYVESPSYYFDPQIKESNSALDALMLTQGWRRYALADVFKGRFSYPDKELEAGQEISGTVHNLAFGKPLPDIMVSLLSPRWNFAAMTRTDSLGRFRFDGFEYPDTTSYVVQALRPKGSNFNLELTVDRDSFPPNVVHFPAFLPNVTDTAYENFVNRSYERNPILRTVLLDEVKVTALKKEFSYSLFASNIIEEKDIKESSGATIVDLLMRVSGIRRANMGKSVLIRGPFESYGYPNLIIDKIVYEADYDLTSIYLEDVERIEVYKGATAVIFGPTGSGALVITTKRGKYDPNKKDIRYHISDFRPLGFQRPAQMYTPVYETEEARRSQASDLRPTLYWKGNGRTGKDGTDRFSFYSSDSDASYTVILEGVTKEGRLIHEMREISIGE